MEASTNQDILNRSAQSDGEKLGFSKNKIQLELVKMLYRMSLLAIVATLVNMVVVIAGLWDHVDNHALVIWTASVLIVTSMRFALVKIYQQSDADPDQARRWEHLFCYGSLAMGLNWAALAWFFFPQADVLHRLVIIFVLAGMTAGSTGSLAPSLLAYLGFNIPPIATMVFLMFSIGGKTYSMLGILILIYIAIQARVAHFYRQQIIQTSINYFKSNALNERVRQAEKRLTDAIESFPEEFALFDIDDHLILCNSKYSKRHGKSSGVENLIGMKFSDLARLTIEKGEVSESETGLRSYFLQGNASGRGSIQLTRQGDIITIHSDYQRSLASETPLTAMQLANEALLGVSHENMAIIRNDILAACNVKLEQLLGYGAGELASCPAQAISPQFSGGINAYIYMQLRDGQAHQGEIELRRKDGALLPCLYSGKAGNPADMAQDTAWVFTAVDH